MSFNEISDNKITKSSWLDDYCKNHVLINYLNDYALEVLGTKSRGYLDDNLAFHVVRYITIVKNSDCFYEISNWTEGKLNGICQKWYPNGQQCAVSNWTKGCKNGLHQSWHDNGQQLSISNWIEGRKNGFYQDWYSDG